MKLFLLCVAVVGLSGLTTGQGLTRQGRDSLSYGTAKVTADNWEQDGAGTYARGQVYVVSESSTVTADEADLHFVVSQGRPALDLALRGNVHVVVVQPGGSALGVPRGGTGLGPKPK
jgi:hypothetical protein